MKQLFGSLTFYITNVCNYNCTDCSYLNNYPIKGHQRWKDNEGDCRKWAERADPALIFILGGEPMINPDFLLWVNGLATIWPMAEIRINTNGSCFDRWPTLYDEILQYQGRVNISISGHNEYNKKNEIDTIKKFLKGHITEQVSDSKIFQKWIWNKIYNSIKDPTWASVESIEDYYALPIEIREEIENVHKVNINDYTTHDEPVDDYVIFTDENGIRVGWARWDNFNTSAIKFDPTKQSMILHDSDPSEAVSVCHGGHCAYIKDGKLYKCQVMGILPELFAQNFPLDVTAEDKKLILSYQPALPTWDDQALSEFVNGLHNQDPIPQCKFCPSSKNDTKIYATTKKIKIVKQKLNSANLSN